MFRSYRIGTLFGFPIEVNLSFLLVLPLFMLWMGFVGGLIWIGMVFGSVLVHELGHALVARQLHVPVAGIELNFFGGAARMIGMPRRPADEIMIAAAGPAVSFALGGLAMLLAGASGAGLLYTAAWVNLILGAFNLIPALPMDGGRILRALLARRMGFVRATETAVGVARGLAIAGGLYGLVTLQLYLVLLAGFVWMLGTVELAMARRAGSQVHRDVPPVEVLPRGFATPRRFVIRSQGGRVHVEMLD